MAREMTNYFASTGGRCLRGDEPCPRMDCRFHVHGDARPSKMASAPAAAVTCALKFARRGGMTLEEVGTVLRLTRERVRQIEVSALGKLEKRLSRRDLGGESRG